MSCDLRQPESPAWQAGDILAFAGRGVTSRIIQGATCSSISHVGSIAWVGREELMDYFQVPYGRLSCKWTPEISRFIGKWEPRFLLFEATTLAGLPCEITGMEVHGVQAHSPDKRIESYNGRVWRYRMTPDWYETFCFKSGPRRMAEKLLRLIGTQYDGREAILSGTKLVKWSRLWAALRGLIPGAKANHAKKVFCSEYLAGVLQHLGMFPIVDASKVNPAELIRYLVNAGVLDEPVLLKA